VEGVWGITWGIDNSEGTHHETGGYVEVFGEEEYE
jgi:hypothetical protein